MPATPAAHPINESERLARDDGPGMTEDEQARLFQPFVQLAGGIKAGGTGLGLVITRHIIEQHGGTLTVSSAPGRGCTSPYPYALTATEAGRRTSSPIR